MMSAFVPLLGTLRNFANSTNIAFFIFFSAASLGNPAFSVVEGAGSESAFQSTSSSMGGAISFGPSLA